MDLHLVMLAGAVGAFVASHFLLSWPPLRARLVGALGERGFLGAYSLVAFALLGWAIVAFRAAPHVAVWLPPAGMRHLAFAIMPVAFVLAVVGLTTRNPTAVGGEGAACEAPRGIVTATRHPFLWGVALWALAHVAANGDAAGMMLFIGMGVLALGGMAAIDHKRTLRLGPPWREFAARTSALPFAAALGGRNRVDWAGIGWLRPLAGLLAFALAMVIHGWLGRPLF